MTEHPTTDEFHNSSFLQGHNATYIEQLYAQYAGDPNAVDEAWQAFFKEMGEGDIEVKAAAAGPSWARNDWPPPTTVELTPAVDGQWPKDALEPATAAEKIIAKAEDQGVEVSEEAIKRAVLDSIRALMIIRAYRIRGHLAADLDPLGLAEQLPHPELDPASYGFTESDMDQIGRAHV